MTPSSTLSAASDKDLVALARQGREDAYGELLRRHHTLHPEYVLLVVRS